MEHPVRLIPRTMIYNHLVVANQTAADSCKVSCRTGRMPTVHADPALERAGKRQWVRIVGSAQIGDPTATLTR